MLWPDTDLSWPEAVVVEVILAGIAWNIGKFITRNVQRFFELRQEIREVLLGAAGAGPWPSDQAAAALRGDPEPATFRALGFQVLLLAQNAPFACWCLRLAGFDLVTAGDNLIGLSQAPGLAFRRERVAQALRFKLIPPMTVPPPAGLERGPI